MFKRRSQSQSQGQGTNGSNDNVPTPLRFNSKYMDSASLSSNGTDPDELTNQNNGRNRSRSSVASNIVFNNNGAANSSSGNPIPRDTNQPHAHHLNVDIHYDRHHSIKTDSSTSPLMTRNNSLMPTSPTTPAHSAGPSNDGSGNPENGVNHAPGRSESIPSYSLTHDSNLLPRSPSSGVLKNYHGFHNEHMMSSLSSQSSNSNQLKPGKPKKLKRRSTALFNKFMPSRRESEISQYSSSSMSPKASANSFNNANNNQSSSNIHATTSNGSMNTPSRVSSSLNLSRLTGKKQPTGITNDSAYTFGNRNISGEDSHTNNGNASHLLHLPLHHHHSNSNDNNNNTESSTLNYNSDSADTLSISVPKATTNNTNANNSTTGSTNPNSLVIPGIDSFILDLSDTDEMSGIISSPAKDGEKKQSVSSSKTYKSSSSSSSNIKPGTRESSWVPPESWKVKTVSAGNSVSGPSAKGLGLGNPFELTSYDSQKKYSVSTNSNSASNSNYKYDNGVANNKISDRGNSISNQSDVNPIIITDTTLDSSNMDNNDHKLSIITDSAHPRQGSKTYTLATTSSSAQDSSYNSTAESLSSANSTCSSDVSEPEVEEGEENGKQNKRMDSVTSTSTDSKNLPRQHRHRHHNHHHHNNNPHTSKISKTPAPTKPVPIPSQFHSKELKGSARSSIRVFKGDKSSVLPCALDTTCQNILDLLRRKRFLKAEDEHMLVLKCGGLIRSLSLDDKPLKIQRNILFLYGYNERDNLDFIERTDLSFLFKFVVQDRGVELISMEKRRKINPSEVNLNNWNLQDIPNFLYAEPIVTLDVSQNPSFEFTNEFIHDCRNLKTLYFTRSSASRFPLSVVYAPKLSRLDLGVNYIQIIPPEIANLKTLTKLSLNCNRISDLPDSFGELENLRYLNLDSNRLKYIPESVLKLKNLLDLDLSYNALTEISPSITNLSKLENLKLSANFLSKELPATFAELKSLIKIDLRFNNLSKIDSLKDLPELMILRATGNNISAFASNAVNLGELELNMNPITFVNFGIPMINLKVIDFSKAKLSSCSFFAKLPAIEKLSLDSNHLVSLPDSIATMKNLIYLSIFKNNLASIPNAIGSLTKLKHLDLHLNNISELNPFLWYLDSLEYLNLSSNLLEQFPEPPADRLPSLRKTDTAKTQSTNKTLDSSVTETDSSAFFTSPISPTSSLLTNTNSNSQHIGSSKRRGSEVVLSPILTNAKDASFSIEKSLKTLCLTDNKLNDGVIQTISMFSGLEYLNLSYNELFEISSGYLCNLKNLKSLYLSGNHLISLPTEDFDSFSEMTTLHINGNRFHALPAELGKISNLTSLDVGSNNLKYNIGNIPYDWNWCYNTKLNYLNFSGNKRLEIKPQHRREGMDEPLDSFLVLKDLKMLGLMDVTITTDAVPDQSTDTRVRSTVSQLGKFGYGISDSFGENKVLSTRDVVIEKFRGNPDEMLIAIYDGKNCSEKTGDKISKIIQETFDIHFIKELESVGTKVDGHPQKRIEDALRGAFLTMNTEMSILINKDESSTFSSAAAHRTTTTDELTLNEEGDKGCCATIVYIKGDDMYVANTGDIMGILTKSNGEYSILTTKHEPYAPEEYERIRESGGFVTTDGYLDGVTDVSRAVGFFKLIPHINAAASTSKFKLTQNEEMVAIATSEVWKQVPYDLAADILRQEKSNPEVAAEKLRDFAISYGSQDKITAVVLSLRQFSSSKQKTHERGSLPEDSSLRKLDEEIEPPTGELAMVFTDIKNSTLLWDSYSSAMRAAIKVHNGIMRRQLRIIGGYEVKTEGDAFMVSFPTVVSALLWCFVVQSQLLTTTEWPAEILASDQGFEVKDESDTVIFRGLSVRMGIHWGRPVCERDIVTKRMDYFGPMVNRASRVSTVADGGQITTSTDFYTEFQRIVKLHKEVKSGKSKKSLAEIYGNKALGLLLESQMEQLEQIGWVEQMIGAKKLKGLETPEKIWLLLPKPLESRLKLINRVDGEIINKAGKLQASGISYESLIVLRKLSLNLEAICSYLNGTRSGSSTKKVVSFTSSSSAVESMVNTEFKDQDMMLFFDHLITRIENCVTVLSLRQTLMRAAKAESTTKEESEITDGNASNRGELGKFPIKPSSDLIDELTQMLSQLSGLNLSFDNPHSQPKQAAPIKIESGYVEQTETQSAAQPTLEIEPKSTEANVVLVEDSEVAAEARGA